MSRKTALKKRKRGKARRSPAGGPMRQGRFEDVVLNCRQATLVAPGDPDVHFKLGNALQAGGLFADAVQSYCRSLQLRPEFPEALNNMGAAMRALGQRDASIECYEGAISMRPEYADAFFNLGTVLYEEGRIADAARCFGRAAELEPDNANAHYNLGNARKSLGMLREAAGSYQRAISARPGYMEALNNLGGVFKELGQGDDAASCYRRARELAPGHPEVLMNLGTLVEEQGRYEEAGEIFRQIQRLRPDAPLLRLRSLSVCPVIPKDTRVMDEWRERLLKGLDACPRIDLAANSHVVGPANACPPFYMVYQGGDDLEVRKKYASLFHAPPYEPPPGRRAGPGRVGLLVTGSHDGVFLTCTRGLLENLRADDLRLTVICTARAARRMKEKINNPAIEYFVLPPLLPSAVQALRAAAFDVIYFWEAGSDPLNYFLPFFRIAPVQCTSWGTPETTGIPQMDLFVSSRHFEPRGAEGHYSERLHLMDSLLSYYYRPPAADPARGRERFGLRPEDNVYVCTQKLVKLHPDFDRVLADILRRDPRGVLVLKDGKFGHWKELLIGRLGAVMTQEMLDRVRFMPHMDGADYLGLIASSNVMLDTLHYSGYNTTLEALALGTPVVTLPGEFMRSRQTLGIYRKLGITDCVAQGPEEYVELAVALGAGRDRREDLSRRIREAASALFEDVGAVSEFEEFFRGAVSLAREAR